MGRVPGDLTGCEVNFAHLVWESGENFSHKEGQFKKNVACL